MKTLVIRGFHDYFTMSAVNIVCELPDSGNQDRPKSYLIIFPFPYIDESLQRKGDLVTINGFQIRASGHLVNWFNKTASGEKNIIVKVNDAGDEFHFTS